MYFTFLLVFYFLLAVVIITLAVFPAARLHTARHLRRSTHFLQAIMLTSYYRANRLISLPVTTLIRWIQTISTFLWQNRRITTIVGIVLLIPPIIALFNKDGHTFYMSQRTRIDSRIQALLVGERLAPPAPLPPTMFTTLEVEQIRPHLAQASRNWDLLDPEFQQGLLLIYQIMRDEHGYDMVLLEGYRSPERQNELAAAGSNVTNARAYQSYHQYGLAADSAFMRNGKIVISEKDPWAMKGYELYGQTAEEVGFVWGGRWKMMDFGHVELRKPGVRKPR